MSGLIIHSPIKVHNFVPIYGKEQPSFYIFYSLNIWYPVILRAQLSCDYLDGHWGTPFI